MITSEDIVPIMFSCTLYSMKKILNRFAKFLLLVNESITEIVTKNIKFF